jgi:formate/nitrite transporter
MNKPEIQPISAYKTPKNTLLVVTKAGIAKGLSLWWQLLALAFHAGVFIALSGGLTIAIAGALDESTSGSIPVYDGFSVSKTSGVAVVSTAPGGLKKMVAGALFPVGLILVVFSGSELFTGNVMYMLAARLGGQTTWQNVLKNWFISYFGNLCGCLMTAFFMFDQTALFTSPNYKNYLAALGHSKVYHGDFGTYFLKGMGGNYLVCLALWMACASDDSVSKMVSLWWPIMTFVCIGFEHSIANMFFVPMAIMNGAPITSRDFVVNNLIPVTIGNMAGAAMFISIQYLIYHPYLATDVNNMQVVQGGKNNETPIFETVDGKHSVPGNEDTIFASCIHWARETLPFPTGFTRQTQQPPAAGREVLPVEDGVEHHDIELAQK